MTVTCLVVAVAVGAGAPPDGHVSGARFHAAGCAAAHEEEPGENYKRPLHPPALMHDGDEQ